MKNAFSEFSYGYALTDDLIRSMPAPLEAAPVFPSLIEEAGLGWDLRLDAPGRAVLLQFKISEYMRNRSAKEYDVFGRPYYRFKIWSRRRSRQHRLLLDLDDLGHDVNYVAPAFHETGELNDAYQQRQVVQRSIFVRPSFIGEFDDDVEHVLVFVRDGSGGWQKEARSEPRRIEKPTDWKTVSGELHRRLLGPDHPSSLREELRRLHADFAKVLGRRRAWAAAGRGHALDRIPTSDAELLREVAQLATTVFTCGLIVVSVRPGQV